MFHHLLRHRPSALSTTDHDEELVFVDEYLPSWYCCPPVVNNSNADCEINSIINNNNTVNFFDISHHYMVNYISASVCKTSMMRLKSET